MSCSKTFTVLGATGNIGSRLISLLLASNHHVRAVVRSKTSKAALEMANKGAELWLVESEAEKGQTLSIDVEALSLALRGADAAFLMIPPNVEAEDPEKDAEQFIKSLRRAVEASQIPRVLLLSSIAAHVSPAIGGVNPLRAFELLFADLTTVQKTYLRVSYFFLNILPNLCALDLGILPYTFSPDAPIPLVSQDDIAEQALHELEEIVKIEKTSLAVPSTAASGYNNPKIVELAGPSDLSFNQVASIISELVKRPIIYLPIPFHQQEQVWISQGLSRRGALDFVDMYASFSNGKATWEHPETLIRGLHHIKDYLAQILAKDS